MRTEIKAGQKAFLTKYAISGDGEPKELTVVDVKGIWAYLEGFPTYSGFTIEKEVFGTREEADAAILEQLDRKVGQVEKQLKKLVKAREKVAARLNGAKHTGCAVVDAQAGTVNGLGQSRQHVDRPEKAEDDGVTEDSP